jgi:hypothetical protein
MRRTPELTAHFEAEYRQASPAAQARLGSVQAYVDGRYRLLADNARAAVREAPKTSIWAA